MQHTWRVSAASSLLVVTTSKVWNGDSLREVRVLSDYVAALTGQQHNSSHWWSFIAELRCSLARGNACIIDAAQHTQLIWNWWWGETAARWRNVRVWAHVEWFQTDLRNLWWLLLYSNCTTYVYFRYYKYIVFLLHFVSFHIKLRNYFNSVLKTRVFLLQHYRFYLQKSKIF